MNGGSTREARFEARRARRQVARGARTEGEREGEREGESAKQTANRRAKHGSKREGDVFLSFLLPLSAADAIVAQCVATFIAWRCQYTD